MMKKNGFTLAEVLITLAIIGVVATMTLPALMQNTQEQQAKTALKKAINTLTEAGQMQNAVEGFDYGSIKSANVGNADAQSLFAIFNARLATDSNLTTVQLAEIAGEGANIARVAADGTGTNDASGNYVVHLRDGSAIIFDPSLSTAADVGTPDADGAPTGFVIAVDTNGAKRPNILSNCGETPDATKSIEDGYDADVPSSGDDQTHDEGDEPTLSDTSIGAACNVKSHRVIGDQFLVRLKGYYAVPEGAAATWAYEN